MKGKLFHRSVQKGYTSVRQCTLLVGSGGKPSFLRTETSKVDQLLHSRRLVPKSRIARGLLKGEQFGSSAWGRHPSPDLFKCFRTERRWGRYKTRFSQGPFIIHGPRISRLWVSLTLNNFFTHSVDFVFTKQNDAEKIRPRSVHHE